MAEDDQQQPGTAELNSATAQDGASVQAVALGAATGALNAEPTIHSAIQRVAAISKTVSDARADAASIATRLTAANPIPGATLPSGPQSGTNGPSGLIPDLHAGLDLLETMLRDLPQIFAFIRAAHG